MVLGMRSKNRKGSSVEVDYLVHVQEIKPWPPSNSLNSVESVLIQWENGDQISGLFTSVVGDGKIEFNQSFRLPITLCREGKSKTHQSFQKNLLDFHLYELRKDKDVKGLLLGSAIVNIADYGIVKETTSIYAPLNCKKSFRSTVQPVLFVKVQPFDKDGSQSAAEIMSEENYEETEIGSITDDDDCDSMSQSSRSSYSSAFEAAWSSMSRKQENKSESAKNGTAKAWRLNTANQQIIVTDVHVSQTPEEGTEKQVSLRSDTLPITRRVVGVQGSNVISNKLQHAKSVQFPSNSANIKRFIGNNKAMDKKRVVDGQEDADNTSTSYSTSERKETAHSFDDSKVELESKVEMLEEELREAAAIEIGLYSVVAEHGSSLNKVHAPARRLSRFYLHACKAESKAKQASAARAAVSGLVLVSKACGNDVPRLAFWLSNSIVLRAIVSKAVEELSIYAGSYIKSNGGEKEVNKKFPLKGNKLSHKEEARNKLLGSSDDWENPQMFTNALEKIEAWIFSRIVESVWWQTLTPHMQSAAAKGSSRKTNVRRCGLGDQEQGNFSIDLWKKAFKDACERLCPIRAGGHECGCLPVLARLVMEQLVDRLDVAMFNAILRESAEEMPTDPVSDPFSDSRVLPIPAGKSSFGAGAQLKNVVGNWSRWLTDLFGRDDDSPENENNLEFDKRPENETSFKAFHLLNTLSDLMMLPLEMLADRSIRKEVCPTLGTPLIKRVLNNFVPDEFCPEPIPESVFEALDSEGSLETDDGSISSFPVSATPPVYSPPPAASLAGVIGDVGSHALSKSGSSVLRKSYTSDDELDELDSPLSSIISGNSLVSVSSTGPDWRPNAKGGRNVVRYKLLRDVWTIER